MSTSTPSPPRLLLSEAMQLMQERLTALQRVPQLDDLLLMLRRLGASDEMCACALASWRLCDAGQDTRVLYLAFSVLGDPDIRGALGELREDASVCITDAVRRVTTGMNTAKELANPALHEDLMRGLAMHLGVAVDDEREATSNYLFQNTDATLAAMAKKSKEYDQALSRAKQAVDNTHRPARPNGE